MENEAVLDWSRNCVSPLLVYHTSNDLTEPENTRGVAGLGDGRLADEPTPLGRGRVDDVSDLDIMSWPRSFRDSLPTPTPQQATLPIE